MSRPWKHPSSGVYWLRKGVPEDLRKLVGKREEKRSLQTRDPVEAKRRHAEALAEIESQWANLRAGPKALTEREAHQLVVYRQGSHGGCPGCTGKFLLQQMAAAAELEAGMISARTKAVLADARRQRGDGRSF
jgi:hypothetical protein